MDGKGLDKVRKALHERAAYIYDVKTEILKDGEEIPFVDIVTSNPGRVLNALVKKGLLEGYAKDTGDGPLLKEQARSSLSKDNLLMTFEDLNYKAEQPSETS